MEITLMFSEIFFYFTASAAIIFVGIFFMVFAYRIIRITKELEKISSNLNHASSEVYEWISDIIDRLSNIPILSYFLEKRSTKQKYKDRRDSLKK